MRFCEFLRISVNFCEFSFGFLLIFASFLKKCMSFFIANIALLEENFFFLFDFSPSRCLFCFFLCISCSCGFSCFSSFRCLSSAGFLLFFLHFTVAFWYVFFFSCFLKTRALGFMRFPFYTRFVRTSCDRVSSCFPVALRMAFSFRALFFFSFNKMKNIRILS